jgi:signal peptidase I
VELNPMTLPLYHRIISVYEGHSLQTKGDQVLIDGEVASTYTFAMNYYFMMGDNRHNSEDSRIWGYVPESHVVGKPVFVWMSIDQTKPFLSMVRWDRVFTTVHGGGKPQSYFVYFVVLLITYFAVRKIMKNRKAKKK